ncbi:MAG TPA: SPOR domain-containing protein [Rhodocyclaceae bacterium]|nr:SPOR domain-containing protein [Rhodocyclaceae bacterium]
MKALVFLLVLANVLFFAYAEGYFGRPDNPDAGRMEQQLNPERIRVVGRGEPPVGEAKKAPEPAKDTDEAGGEAAGKDVGAESAAPADKAAAPADKPMAAAAPAGPQSCVVWSELTGPEATRLASLVEEKFTDFKAERRATPVEGGGWWVFIPPLPSKADAERKAGELKRMGVSDFFVVQDAGPNRFAISLGVFSNEQGANDQLANLKAKGVRSAKVGQRITKDALHAVEARGPAARQAALVAAAKAALPEIASQTCK